MSFFIIIIIQLFRNIYIGAYTYIHIIQSFKLYYQVYLTR